MWSKSRFLMSGMLLFIAALNTSAVHADGLPAGATMLDDNVVMYMRPVPLVSPDGRQVAYVSRGFVCVADVVTGTSRRLVEVPSSWSHVFASVVEASQGGSPDSLKKALGWEKYKALLDGVEGEIVAFQWTGDSSAIVFSVSSYDATERTHQIRFWRAPLEGTTEVIAHSRIPLTSRRGPGGTITRDGRFLVGNFGSRRALIWSIEENAPRATPFLYLTPSPTSERWLGVEKDTRQLVVLDKGFGITRRYEEILPPARHGFEMIWSPDERFVFWREQIGFDYSSNWVGCRFDLQSGERDIFTGDYMSEEIAFMGCRGEFLRVGSSGVQLQISGLHLVENYVGMVPDGRHHLQHFWSMRSDSHETGVKVRMLSRGPNVTWSPDFQLFTIGLPRQEGVHGEVYHLANRERNLWRLPGDDRDEYVSPYRVAGFALDGKTIIAYDDRRLFAVPVSAIQTPENKVR